MINLYRRFARDSSASTVVEYGIVLVFVAFVMICALHAVGIDFDTAFNMVTSGVANLL